MLAGTHNGGYFVRKSYGSTRPGPLLYGSRTEVDQITEATHIFTHLHEVYMIFKVIYKDNGSPDKKELHTENLADLTFTSPGGVNIFTSCGLHVKYALLRKSKGEKVWTVSPATVKYAKEFVEGRVI